MLLEAVIAPLEVVLVVAHLEVVLAIVLLEVWIPAENFSGVIIYSIVLIGGFYDGMSLVGGRIENRPVVNICSRE